MSFGPSGIVRYIDLLDMGVFMMKNEHNKPISPSFWPGDISGGKSGYTDHEEIGPIGAGTAHARMHWFWERMRTHERLIEELTGWNPVSSKYRFEAAIADAFDKLAEKHETLK